MPTLSPRMILALPDDSIDLANRLAVLFDPEDGSRTFIEERRSNGYVWAETPVYVEYEALVRGRDPNSWYAFLSQAAATRGFEPLTFDECTRLCQSLLIDDEFNRDQTE